MLSAQEAYRLPALKASPDWKNFPRRDAGTPRVYSHRGEMSADFDVERKTFKNFPKL